MFQEGKGRTGACSQNREKGNPRSSFTTLEVSPDWRTGPGGGTGNEVSPSPRAVLSADAASKT